MRGLPILSSIWDTILMAYFTLSCAKEMQPLRAMSLALKYTLSHTLHMFPLFRTPKMDLAGAGSFGSFAVKLRSGGQVKPG